MHTAGPWQTCELTLCPKSSPQRTLTSCTTTSCNYTNGNDKAYCNTTGLVPQGVNYVVTSTAIKADGVRTSQTGSKGTYNFPLYPYVVQPSMPATRLHRLERCRRGPEALRHPALQLQRSYGAGCPG